jgi:hypothetical protein
MRCGANGIKRGIGIKKLELFKYDATTCKQNKAEKQLSAHNFLLLAYLYEKTCLIAKWVHLFPFFLRHLSSFLFGYKIVIFCVN